MSRYKTYYVCEDCLYKTKTSDPPILAEIKKRGTCSSCGAQCLGIKIGYYHPDNKYYEIRRKQYSSVNSLCHFSITDICDRGLRCRYAHNRLELELWIEQDRMYEEMRRPSSNKIRCVICDIEFREVYDLEIHLRSRDHVTRTTSMKILPEVGSSLLYKGPIRERPKVPFGMDTYELCRHFMKHGRCDFLFGCKHAHSEEELRVWIQAQIAEEESRKKRRWQSQSKFRSHSSSSYANGNANPSGSYSRSKSESFSSSSQNQDESEEIEGESEYYWRVQGEIGFLKIEDVVKNMPDHIEILCNNHLEQTMEESSKEFKWVFRVKSSKQELVHGIMLYDDRNMFNLGGVHKGVEGGKYGELNFPYIPNRICYQLQQEIDRATFIDVNLVFIPQLGQHQVYIVVECMTGGLVAREINVIVKGVTFQDANESFKDETKPPPKKKVPPAQDILPVNWEHKFQLFNNKISLNKHRIPENIEERLKEGFFDKIKDKILKDSYAIRFQTLLQLEEYEHRKSLIKYDLYDYEISYKTVDKEMPLENDYGEERMETAKGNHYFIRFNLKHQLFEGYRAFRPPRIAYIIPKYTKVAYECNCVRTGIDYLIFSVTTDTIETCERSGGLAMVRFTPERDEYEKMHQALDDIKPLKGAILFPTLRPVHTPRHWDEDHLLSLLNYETLTTTQKEAVYSIINSKYTSIPTIICGPFGCGKTKTLAIAAKLIALTFHNSGILITTKTNSCANLYIDLLKEFFDGIDRLYDKQSRRPKLFRHFAITRNIFWDKKMQYFTNIRDGVYKRLPLNELERCSIVVTTTVASSSLIHPKDRDCTKNLFTHIFIDEAAQLIEPEACIPLSLAGLDTKIALAGDVRQSRPLILSKQGRQFHLDQSLLERFETLPEYQPHSPYKCNITLLENFRSSVEIVCFLSELFYGGSLRSNPPTLEGPADFPSLSFLHVKGEERRLYGFPSFYNEEEAELTIGVLRKFANLGVRVENMAVLTTYKSQVRLIYDYLRYEEMKCRNLGHFQYRNRSCRDRNCVNKRTIDVRNLEGIQGMEYDLIVVNTVRTIIDVPKDISLEERLDLGLLDDVKQFNTILTRARGWVVVIGDSDCVTNIGNCSNVWSKYLEACKGNRGFFQSLKELEKFVRISQGRERKTETKTSKTTGTETRILRKIETETRSLRTTETGRKTSPIEGDKGMAPPEDHNEEASIPYALYQTKFNALYLFITTCQHEITQVHDNPYIAAVINDQLTFARIALENLEKQSFEVKRCKKREKVEGKRTKPIESKKTGDPVGSFEDVFPPEDHTDETYRTKFNSLQVFITTCQQEITETHASREITAAIKDQLTFAKIALENLEKQRCPQRI